MTVRRSTLVPSADLLVALNVADGIPRGAACRLAAQHERWLGLGARAVSARELGVPAAALRAAMALGATAPETAARERRTAASFGATIVSCVEESYPGPLQTLDLPPPALYVRGELEAAPAIAIVGSRRASAYGLATAEWLARELAAAGLVVVSGFAAGIDAAAHRGAIASEGGRTMAILGCGLDVDYPRGHRALGRRIAAHGALVSEFPFGRIPAAWQFPVRNRLIAALAEACVVVEATPRSGSLITARLALELGREILAVPGRVSDELALGPNQLIADGARPALDPRDVLEAIAPRLAAESRPAAAEPAGLPSPELALWRVAESPASAEALAARCELPVETALAALLGLELAGHLGRSPDGVYRRLGSAFGLRPAKAGW